MTRKDLERQTAADMRCSIQEASSFVDSFLKNITNGLANGEKVVVTGFGTFEMVERKPRSGRNKYTGEITKIPACVAPVFRAGRALKRTVCREV